MIYLSLGDNILSINAFNINEEIVKKELVITRYIQNNIISINDDFSLNLKDEVQKYYIYGILPINNNDCFYTESYSYLNNSLQNLEVKFYIEPKGDFSTDKVTGHIFIDNSLLNIKLIEQGYFKLDENNLDSKYQNEYINSSTYAKNNKLGIWGSSCECIKDNEVKKECTSCNKLTISRSNWDCSIYTTTQTDSLCSYLCTPVKPIFSCDCKKTCTQISTCSEAYFQLNECNCQKRDNDNDGIPCENLCE